MPKCDFQSHRRSGLQYHQLLQNRQKFNQQVNTETITSELHLYCDSRKADRVLLQTTVGFGNWLGLCIVAWLGDRMGRKFWFCIGLLLLNATWVCQLVGVYLKSVELLLLAEFNSGCSNKLIYLNFLVLLTRFMKKESYEKGTLGWLLAAHGFSQIAIALINQLFQSWRAVVLTYALGIFSCSIASLLLLKQDPFFLFENGHIQKVKQIIQSIGKENEENFQNNQQNLKRIDDCFQIKMQRVENNVGMSDVFNLREILRWDIFFTSLIIGLAGCSYLMVSKSIELSIQSLKYSYNFNLFIIGISNVFGFTTAIYINKMERQKKRGLIYTSLIYGAIAMLFLFAFCKENGVVETILIFFLRFFLCWSCNFYTRLKVDSFPERYQVTIIGLVQFFINFGTLLSPSLVQKSVEHHISPIVTLNIFRLMFGTLPVIFLIEKRVRLSAGQQECIQPDKQIEL